MMDENASNATDAVVCSAGSHAGFVDRLIQVLQGMGGAGFGHGVRLVLARADRETGIKELVVNNECRVITYMIGEDGRLEAGDATSPEIPSLDMPVLLVRDTSDILDMLGADERIHSRALLAAREDAGLPLRGHRIVVGEDARLPLHGHGIVVVDDGLQSIRDAMINSLKRHAEFDADDVYCMPDRPGWQSSYGPAARGRRRIRR